MQMHTPVVRGAAVLVALAVTVVAGAFGSPRLSDLARPSWQPTNAAFSIWALIYASIAAGAGIQVHASAADRASSWSVALLCTSLFSSAAWLLTVGRAIEVSAACIVVAFLAALFSLLSDPPPLQCRWNSADRVVSLGPALLTGWLSVTAPLGVNLAVQARGAEELPGWVVLPSSLTAAVVGGVCGTPEVGAVLLWAAAFSKRTPLSTTLGLVGILSSIASVVRSI